MRKTIKSLFCLVVLASPVLSNSISLTERKPNLDNNGALSFADVAETMYNSLDQNVDPCDDFYNYACGNWYRQYPRPDDFYAWSPLYYIQTQNILILENQLEEVNGPSTEAENKARTFYRSCMDPNGIINKRGLEPLIDQFNQWAYISESQNNSLVINESLSNLLTSAQLDFKLNTMFAFDVINDFIGNPSVNNIQISADLTFLSNSINVSSQSELDKKFKDFDQKIGFLFVNASNKNEMYENVIKFDQRLHQIMETSRSSYTNDLNSNSLVKIDNLSGTDSSFFNWTTFFNYMLNTSGSSETLTDEDMIMVKYPNYFVVLNELVSEYERAGLEDTVKLWVLINIATYASTLTVNNNVSNRWQLCIDNMNDNPGMDSALARMLLRGSSDRANNITRGILESMVESIKQTFLENVPNVTWLENETRPLVEEKLKAMEKHIGYPDFIENDELLNAMYQDLVFDADDYFGNTMRLRKYQVKSKALMFRKPLNTNLWKALYVNAENIQNQNQMYIYTGILHTPFFNSSNPMSINYGAIGMVIGHEITHGFDDAGRFYDKTGMLKVWWSNDTMQNFENAAQCMIEQYSADSFNNKTFVNGKQTLGENIADNGGIRFAFEAYQKWVEQNGEEKPLPILGLSHEQLFFLSFAQNWCDKSTDNALQNQILTDVHSPNRFRIINTLSNSNEFANAFNCPINSPMNPVKKCKVW